MPQFIRPVEGPISRGFYYKASLYIGGQHAAIDIPANTGTPIKAAAGGTVYTVEYDRLSGHFVGLQHSDGWWTYYRHLQSRSELLFNESVLQGRTVGYVGSSGVSTGPHLHFDLWNKEKVRDDWAIFSKHGIWAVDPELYLGKEDDTMADGHAPGELHVSPEEWQEIHNNVERTKDLRTDYNNLLKAVQALQKDTLASGDVIKVELVE